jgi:hypothetical protein
MAMTDPSNNKRPSGAGFWLVQLIIVAALVIAAFFLGRSHAQADLGGPSGSHVEDDHPSLEDAQKLLQTAREKKEWSSADESTFTLRLARLSLKTRMQLAGRLANLINTGELKLKVEHNEPDVPVCVPGKCQPVSATPTTAPNPKEPAPR